MSELAARIRERYERVLDTISGAARNSNRDPGLVRLVVVTKMQPVETVRAAIEAGAKILGENYAEEAVEKISTVGVQSGVEWHMIGHVQSRKASLVAQHFDLIHSLDSWRLAQRLDKAAAEAGRTLPALLEFNVSGEQSKHGWAADDEAAWVQLLDELQAVTGLGNIRIRGLMTMPPLAADPEAARGHFQKLRRLRDYLVKQLPQAQWEELSMGTSADYAVAIEEGATLVRVGQAILGPRPTSEGK